MTHPFELESTQLEPRIARMIADPAVTRREIKDIIAAMPTDTRFILNSTWISLSRDPSLATWRRLESYKLFLDRCLTYPCDLEFFLREAITALGIAHTQITDVSKAQQVPILRHLGELIFRVELPLSTPIEPAAVFYAVNRSSNTVERVYVDQLS